MPSLKDHISRKVTKALLIGDSGTGKTGALASLADAGYNLRILDFDNGIDVLFNVLRDPQFKYKPEALDRVQYVTLTEDMRVAGGKVIPASAKVWQKCVGMLDNWVDGDTKLGKVTTWTDKDVLVIDSLTRLSEAAFRFHRAMNGRLAAEESGNEWRRDIGTSQGYVQDLLEMLYSTAVPCNVLIISHITYVKDRNAPPAQPGDEMPMIGYPSTIGAALSPKVPQYFNNTLFFYKSGTGPATRREMHTQPLGLVMTKTSAPNKVKRSYPIETGLAKFFEDVRGA